MIIARVTCTFDRGCAQNSAKDLDMDELPTETVGGGVIRGLGTHYRDEEAKQRATELAAEEQRVRAAFKERFVAAPLPGHFVLPRKGAGKQLVDRMTIDPDLKVRVTEYYLRAAGDVEDGEIMEWATRVRRQLGKVPLGRGKSASAKGLRILEELARCPVLGVETADAIRQAVEAARLDQLGRVDLKRRIAEIKVDVDVGEPVAPRRAKAVESHVDVGEPVAPRRRGRVAEIGG